MGMPLMKFRKGFRKFFPDLDAGKFIDRNLIGASPAPIVSIDVMQFDDWLHEKFGEYEKKKLSMARVIEKHFGKDAMLFIKEAI